MIGGEGVEAAPVEGTGLDVGQRFAFEGVRAVAVEVAHAVARRAHGDDLPAAVIEARETATMPLRILKNDVIGSPARNSVSCRFQWRIRPAPAAGAGGHPPAACTGSATCRRIGRTAGK